jgi:tRNA 5-methylaminomethyl-2-thiouridine biosynthesis bifunctional protein
MGHCWQHLPAWRVLDTDFRSGQTFLATWNAWLEDGARPRVLHYVALCAQPCSAQDLQAQGASNPLMAALAQELAERWFGLMPGFHRFLLAHGQVVLTLCVGDTLALLRAQQFEADAVELFAHQANAPDFPWVLKALARCCRRGTTLALHRQGDAVDAELRAALTQNGFTCQPNDTHQGQLASTQACARFDPPWVLKNTRQGAALAALPIARCAIIGAGLAGASVAAALARRGWQVQVLDRAGAPVAGASGLPVGLVVPHVSRDDCALSRLSRAGVRLMLQQAGDLLKINQDWAPSGVLERQMDGTSKLPKAWPSLGEQWSESYPERGAAEPLGAGIWHRPGAWIKPAALVNAWLAQPGVTFQPDAKVADMRCQEGVWELLDAAGTTLCRAERVVLANAAGAFHLLQKMKHLRPDMYGLWDHLPATQGMRGLLNWDFHQAPIDAGFPTFPVNGSGSVVPRIPVDGKLAWFMGSSYQPESQPERSDMANQANNFKHLEQLLPPLACHLAGAFATDTLNTWKNTRCVTADRLPAVGPLQASDQPGLWLCAGMGSRGLSFSVLCAELLAARFGAEPLPIEAKLASSLEALRD